MADWGLYAALRGQDNWAQRRADAQMNTRSREKHLAMEEKKTQQRVMAEEGINAYLDAMKNIDVLPEDQERIKEVERQARHNIVKGIAQNNGDLSRYVSSGGITDLHDYKNSIMQSGEVKTALSNKENMAKILTDKQAGNRWFKPIEVEIEEQDENGNTIMKKQMVDVDKQLQMFKDGSISKIGYNGSEIRKSINSMAFKNQYKDSKNPRGPNNVTTSDLVFHAMNDMGTSKEYANYLADNYAKRIESGVDPWKWKGMSAQDESLMNAKTYKLSGGQSGGDSEQQIANYYNNALNGRNREIKTGTYAEWGGKGAKYKSSNFTLEEADILLRAIGLDQKNINKDAIFDKNNNYIDVEEINHQNHSPGGVLVSPRTGDEVIMRPGSNYSIVGVDNTVININGMPYIRAQVYMDEDAADNSGIRSTSGIDHITDGWKGLTEKKGGGGASGENYMVETFVPLNDSPNASAYYSKEQAGTNKQEELGVNETGYGGSATLDLNSLRF